MTKYTIKEVVALKGLRKIINDPNKPEDVKNVAKRIIHDDKLLAEYILLKEKRLETIRRKKVLEERKKNLTGWKKWFKLFLPEGVILRQG